MISVVGFLHLRLAATGLVFSALAFGQTAPDSTAQEQLLRKKAEAALQERLKSLKLIDRSHITIQQTARPSSCAIPLLNALPAKGEGDFRIRTFRPGPNTEGTNAATPQIGLPACEPEKK
jgi:hypothetical protein